MHGHLPGGSLVNYQFRIKSISNQNLGFLLVVAAIAFVFHMLIEAPFGNAWGLVLRNITSNVPIKKERISLEKINPEAETENYDPEENSKL